MRRFYAFAVLFAVAILLVAAGGAEAQKKKKMKGVSGTLADVVAGKEGNEGTLVVKVMPNKKKDPNGEAKEIKIKLAKDTTVQKTVGKKKDKQTVAAAFTDFQIGQHVTITLRPGSTDQAQSVLIGGKKKKKTKT